VTTYVDASALVKRYLDEPDADRVTQALSAENQLVTGRHTIVEVRRNLARLLLGRPHTEARATFASEIAAFAIVELDRETIELAATIGEQLGVRSLDALHLGAAQRAGGPPMHFLTFDLRQAQAARTLGFTVVGA
jgi:predicted nucleic acid-binding protein